MKQRAKRHILLPIALLLYTAIMAIFAYPRYQEEQNWKEYFLIIGIGVVLAILLFFVLKRRQRIRDNFTKKD